jgi:integrase
MKLANGRAQRPHGARALSGGQREVEAFAKWQWLTCHTARRTFLNLSLEQEISNQIVMKVSGHEAFITFYRYLNLAQSAVANASGAAHGSAAASWAGHSSAEQ